MLTVKIIENNTMYSVDFFLTELHSIEFISTSLVSSIISVHSLAELHSIEFISTSLVSSIISEYSLAELRSSNLPANPFLHSQFYSNTH